MSIHDLHRNYERVRLVLTATPTVLVTIGTVITIVVDELGDIGPLPAWFTTAAGAALTIVGVSVAIIRRVTPVLDSAIGLDPPVGPATAREAAWRDAAMTARVEAQRSTE